MSFKQRVESAKIEKRKQNIEQVRLEITSDWVEKKIEGHLSRFQGLTSKEKLSKEILENDIVASFFAKDPSKQNISEKLAEEELQLPKLPAMGVNCIRFKADGTKTHLNSASTKSADFKYGSTYITQKYTKEAGGAQDNQFNDVYLFLDWGAKLHSVAAIVDGDFWDNGKREQLKKMFKEKANIGVYSLDEFKEACNERRD